MYTLGIDVAKHRHHATLLDESGATVFRNVAVAHSREGFEQLLAKLAATASPDGIRVGMEATGHYWMVLYEALTQAGYTVDVINPLVISARRNITIRGSKTDSIDSLLIALVLRETQLKVCAIADDQVQQLRDLTRLRFECAQTAIGEKHRLVSLLDLAFPEYGDHFSDLFGSSSRAVLAAFPTARQLAKVDIRRLTRLLQESSRGYFGRAQAQRLKEAAKSSFALAARAEALALEIRFVIERLNLLIEQIAQLEKRWQTMMVEQRNLLQSIPGLGKVWAPTILAEILPVFQPEHRHGARKLVAAAGVDVKLSESGDSKGHGKMSKRGSRYLRTAVMQAAEIAVFRKHDPLFTAIYKRQKDRGKHHMVALTHVANKMLHVIFSVLKNERPYTPILT
jgi:transposase